MTNRLAMPVTCILVTMLLATSINAQGQMTKMCLFYPTVAGHARSDPIIDQNCASGHVHTFYGPLNFHPNTKYEDLRDTKPEHSTSPFVENQSSYWHPSIYEVTINPDDGVETFTRVSELETSPYYRWDNSVEPKTEAFPPGFRMIAASNDPGANNGGEMDENMMTECCSLTGTGEDKIEECVSWSRLEFPSRNCDFLGIALAMPTCWNGELGDTNDHKSHMTYTHDGAVAGDCPSGWRRLPQVQLFVRINDYKGADRRYQLSDGNSEFHFDFFNAWEEGKLQEIIDNCPVQDQEIGEYNPPCGCDEFLTRSSHALGPNVGPMCDADVQRLILDEATDVVVGSLLPKDACQGPPLEPKSWNGPDLSTVDLDVCRASVIFGVDDEDDNSGDSGNMDSEDEDCDPDVEGCEEEEIICQDDPDFRFRNRDSKDCEWVADRPRVRCERKWRGEMLEEYCPEACGLCHEFWDRS